MGIARGELDPNKERVDPKGQKKAGAAADVSRPDAREERLRDAAGLFRVANCVPRSSFSALVFRYFSPCPLRARRTLVSEGKWAYLHYHSAAKTFSVRPCYTSSHPAFLPLLRFRSTSTIAHVELFASALCRDRFAASSIFFQLRGARSVGYVSNVTSPHFWMKTRSTDSIFSSFRQCVHHKFVCARVCVCANRACACNYMFVRDCT